MPGESQQPPNTRPDPSVFTTEAIERQARSDRDYLDAQIQIIVQRFASMDEATKVLHESVTRIPTDVQQAVGHLKELTAVELNAIAKQFLDGKVALDAAFAAQEKLGVQQNLSNQTSMNKTEASIKESIDKLSELFKTTTDALADKIDDLKTRVADHDAIVTGIVQRTGGATEQRSEARQASSASSALIFGAIAAGATIIGLLITVALIVANKGSN